MTDTPDPDGTRVDIEAIEARAEAATEGPWIHLVVPDYDEDGPTGEECPTRSWSTPESASEDWWWQAASEDDAAFIAHARTDVPALVARVRELEGERDYEARRAAELSEEIANCNVLATEARATAAEAVVARVATREFAERYLAEWVKPYFGDDATDAAACVQRAMTAALAPTTTEGSDDR